MFKSRKIIIFLFLALPLLIAGFIYTMFNGFPWEKASVAKELEIYLEDKYEQEFTLKSSHFNFKDSTYFGYFYPVNEPDLEFIAEEGFGEYEYVDTYPEVTWANQLKEDLEPIYNEIYPEITAFKTHYLTYENLDMDINREIPRYNEVDATITAAFTINIPFTDSDEEWKQMTELIIEIQSRSDNSDTTFNYIDNVNEVETFLICPTKSEHPIESSEDAKTHCSLNEFDLIDE